MHKDCSFCNSMLEESLRNNSDCEETTSHGVGLNGLVLLALLRDDFRRLISVKNAQLIYRNLRQLTIRQRTIETTKTYSTYKKH